MLWNFTRSILDFLGGLSETSSSTSLRAGFSSVVTALVLVRGREFAAQIAGPFIDTPALVISIGANASLLHASLRIKAPLEKELAWPSFASPTAASKQRRHQHRCRRGALVHAGRRAHHGGAAGGRQHAVGRGPAARGRAGACSGSSPRAALNCLAKRVGLHAVTRDTQTFPEPCLYVQLLLSDAAADDAVSELFLVPPDAAALEPLFDALSRTAELNPDSDDESDESDGGMLGIGE